MPLVSVIVPAHNAAPFIEQTIESVRRQTCADWEVIAVDDGSSDETWEVLRNAGPRVRCFRREQAGGPAVARNLALRHADGELVVFLDADDLLLPDYLDSQLACYNAAARSPGAPVGLVSCDARLLIEDRFAPYTHLQRLAEPYAPITLERLLRRNPIYGACLVPVEVGEAVGWFDPQLYGTEDFGLWIKILERGYRAVLNDRVLAVYRRTPGTVSSDLASQARNNSRAYRLALARGRLNRRQRRIAKGAIRYNRAMEQVARLRFDTTTVGSPRSWRVLASVPLLAWVALSNPRRWSEWLQLLRSGRAKGAAQLRATS